MQTLTLFRWGANMNTIVDFFPIPAEVEPCALTPWPTDERQRLKALRATRVLQNYPAEALQQLTEVAACVADAPVAMVSFIDYEHSHVLCGVNCAPRTDPRFETLCAHAIAHPEEVTIVQDIFADPRFAHLRHLGLKRNFRFYAGAVILSPDGYPIGTLCVLDIEPRTLSERQIQALRNVAKAVTPRLALAMQIEKLEEERAKFRAFMDNGPMVAFLKDADGHYEYANQRLLDRFGMTGADIIGKKDADLWPGHVADQLRINDEYVMTNGQPVELTEAGPADASGEATWWQSYKFVVPGERDALGGVAIDVSALKGLQTKLERLACTDALTQLPNRLSLMEHLPRAIAGSRQFGEPMAVLFMDIDHFKQVNDSYGHEAGDKVLVEFAARVRETVRHTDIVARLAGDEFVVVLEHLGDAHQAERIARKILCAMERPLCLGSYGHAMSISIGIALLNDSDADATTLLDRADKALYQAKAAGRRQLALLQ